MATATMPRPAPRKRLWPYNEMLAELPESNLDPEAQTIEVFSRERGAFKLTSKAELGETASSKLLSGFAVSWSQLIL